MLPGRTFKRDVVSDNFLTHKGCVKSAEIMTLAFKMLMLGLKPIKLSCSRFCINYRDYPVVLYVAKVDD